MRRRDWLKGAAAALTAPALRAAAARELQCDLLVVGGGVGGFAAALAGCRCGLNVVLTEETDWIGGQLTAQAVPPDEHPWIEQFGCTKSYREYRTAVREAYRRLYPLTAEARQKVDLNPGNGSVSRLTNEFAVSVSVLEGMLAPFAGAGRLTLLREHVPVSAEVNGDRVTSVTLQDLRQNRTRTIDAKYVADATELGDLLSLTKCESVTGAESRATGEMHAPAEAQPANSQSFTYCFCVDQLDGQDHTIDKPADYEFWRDYVPDLKPAWTGKLLSWQMCDPKTLAVRKVHFDPNPDPTKQAGEGLNLWIYRRIADRKNFVSGTYRSDTTLVNWPQNDFWLGDLVTADTKRRLELQRRAKQLSLSLLYWMQTEAPRPDGGQGWKGLRLRKDLVGTEDGLAKSAYVRESRRIKAEFTVLEQHVGTDMRSKIVGGKEALTAEKFKDSVGIGCYRIDLHPSAGGTNYIDVSSLPFQIPLGALIPQRIRNLIPACKNIGTTHITNGCYRLHPVEWNIGEAAGMLAAESLRLSEPIAGIRDNGTRLTEFQQTLVRHGFELDWPDIHPV